MATKNSSRGSSGKTNKATTYKNATVEAEAQVVPIVPLNNTQGLYKMALEHSTQVIALGPSGTGKTWMPVVHACNLYLKKKAKKIIITRPAVSVGKSLGSLPGDISEKFEPWLGPILTTMKDVLGAGRLETAVRNGNIVYAPLEYMRGASYDDTYVIMDEAQNLTIEEAKMFLTRQGENCKLVLCGDIKQSDLKVQSGLSKAIHLAKKYNMDVSIIEFSVDDIVRSPACKAWVEAFYEENL